MSKKKRRKWDYDKVKAFVEGSDGNGCKLLSKDYKNGTVPLHLLCKCGEEFEVTFSKFNYRNKRQCNKCGVALRAKKRRLSIKDVRLCVESEGCQLVSSSFKGVDKPLQIKCSCGDIFVTNYKTFKHDGKNSCNECTGYHRWDYIKVKDYVLANSDSKLVSKKYVNNTSPLKFRCSCGEAFTTSLKNFQVGKRTCDTCGRTFIDTTGLRLGRQSKKYEDIKYYIETESGSDCKLLSEAYISGEKKLQLKCKCGEVFYTSYNSFLHSDTRRCKKCTSKLVSSLFKLKYEDVKHFINIKSSSGCELMSKEYLLAKELIDIKCWCGRVFTTSWDSFKNKGKRQCNECGWQNTSDSLVLSYNDIANRISNHMGAELVTSEDNYTNTRSRIDVKCSCGSTYNTTYNSFINSNGKCPECAAMSIGDSNRKTTEKFTAEVSVLGENKYVLISDYFGAHEKVSIMHLDCGRTYEVTPTSFLSGSRCPQCRESKGERRIRVFLESLYIKYTYDKSICKNLISSKGMALRYDFHLPGYNLLIEYDGEQHYRPVNFGGCSDSKALLSHNATKFNDNIKNQYCKDNNIPLLRIPYWEFDNIETILEEFLTEHGVIELGQQSNEQTQLAMM